MPQGAQLTVTSLRARSSRACPWPASPAAPVEPLGAPWPTPSATVIILGYCRGSPGQRESKTGLGTGAGVPGVPEKVWLLTAKRQEHSHSLA